VVSHGWSPVSGSWYGTPNEQYRSQPQERKMEIKVTQLEIDEPDKDVTHSWRGRLWVNIGDNPPYMFVAHGKDNSHVYIDLGSSVSDFRDGCQAMGAPENVLAYLTELSLNLYRASTAIVTRDASLMWQAVGGYNG